MTCRLLIVPDDLLRIQLGPSYMDRRGVAVRSAVHGEEALGIVLGWEPDLLIFGADLGDMSAQHFVERIAKIDAQVRPRLMLITSQVGEEAVAQGLALPCDSHLVAPVSEEQLLDTAAALVDLDQRRAPRVRAEIVVLLEEMCVDDNPSTMAISMDISECGMRVESEELLSTGSEGTAKFVLRGTTERLIVRCAVRAVIDEIQQQYGLEFRDLTPHQLELLQNFVQSQLEAEGTESP